MRYVIDWPAFTDFAINILGLIPTQEEIPPDQEYVISGRTVFYDVDCYELENLDGNYAGHVPVQFVIPKEE